MVIVEFFSQTPIDNMISALTNTPEKVVFVGDLKRMKKYDTTFQRFLHAIGNTTTCLEYWNIKIHELSEIVKVLEQIVGEYPGCHFDITGGDPMSMAAIGIIYERYRNQGIELHQYNIRTGKVYDCDLNGQTVSADIPCLTVEQNIILHGGSIVGADIRENGSYCWSFDDGFLNDLSVMWEICRANCSKWNFQITMLEDMWKHNSEANDGLQLKVSISQMKHLYARVGMTLDLNGIFYQLERVGLIQEFVNEGCWFELTFKNEQIKRCLTKAGTILELITYLTAQKVIQKDGTPYYSAMQTGVFIDWDGIVHNELDTEVDTENEIDVVLMRGAVPIFISCKNGNVGEEELYKLSTVADKFGGAYVKKVLVGTTLGKGIRSKQYFLERAKDMKIQVIEGVHEMSEEDFIKSLKTLA